MSDKSSRLVKSKHVKSRHEKKKKHNYNSGMGFLVSIWGNLLWPVLHMMSLNYPVHPTKENKKHYYKFIWALQHVLPCRFCRDNLPSNLTALGFISYKCKHLKSRLAFSKFIYKLRDRINKMLGKTSDVSFKEMRDTFENFRATCDKKKKKEVKKTEKGCSNPSQGRIKSKCILKIVPQTTQCQTIEIDPICLKSNTI